MTCAKEIFTKGWNYYAGNPLDPESGEEVAARVDWQLNLYQVALVCRPLFSLYLYSDLLSVDGIRPGSADENEQRSCGRS